MSEKELVPVLLGLDLNGYSMALSFYEAFGVTSHAFGRYACGITERSKFIRTHVVPSLCDPQEGLAELRRFRMSQKDAELVLVPCADWYVALLEEIGDRLEGYRFVIPPRSVLARVRDKATFLDVLDEAGLPHPKTQVFRYGDPISSMIKVGHIPYPAVVKPSDSTEFWRHPFSGMQKVAFVKNEIEAVAAIRRIFSSGYEKSVLLQEKIGQSKEPSAETLTVCCADGGRCAGYRGKIVLEETGATARGNYCAIVTVPLNRLCRELMELCRRIGYVGIANFDILQCDGKWYVLEMNPRQGRSCDYVRAAGGDLARFLMAAIRGEPIKPQSPYSSVYWRCVPDRTVFRYASDPALVEEARMLLRAGYAFSPFHATEDTRANPLRSVYVVLHEWRRAAAIGSQNRRRAAYGGG